MPTDHETQPRLAPSGQLRVLLVSCYELGQQPLGIAWPAAFLKRAGFHPEVLDLALDEAPDPRGAAWDLIVVSTPMHTALSLALKWLASLRGSGSTAHVCFHGHYAELFRDQLQSAGVDSVLSAESEEDLVALAQSLASKTASDHPIPGGPRLKRLDFPLPDRSSLRPMSQYLRLSPGGGVAQSEDQLVASVEASRGCRHMCRHCPIPPVYGGRFFVIPESTVLQDVDRLVEAGAGHVHFVDPDFLNGPTHALRICESMHRRHPSLSFDFTAKVEHLLARGDALHRMKELGCLFITTAVESLSDEVLRRLDKGHRRVDVDRLVRAMREAGIAMKPTWVPFTPWTTRTDYVEMLEWIAENDLVEDIDLVQLTIRLLVPRGSLLIAELDPGALGPADKTSSPGETPFDLDLSVAWRHPDPAMDALRVDLSRRVQAAASHPSSSHRQDFNELGQIAGERLGIRVAPLPAPSEATEFRARPRLTENWFC